jgi:hypothetical protein
MASHASIHPCIHPLPYEWKSGTLPSSKSYPGDGFLPDNLFGLMGREAILEDSAILESALTELDLQRFGEDEMDRALRKYPESGLLAGMEIARLRLVVYSYQQLFVAERRRYLHSQLVLPLASPEDLSSF